MKFIDIHSHSLTVKDHNVIHSLDVSEFSQFNVNNYFTTGIHPWKISTTWKTDFIVLKKIISSPECVGIGETGLDRLKGENFSIQEEVLFWHIQLSEETQLPLVLHVVRSYEKILEIHKKLHPKSKWIVHGFQSSLQVAEQLWKKNIYTSFGESLLLSKKLQKVFQEAPLEFCFLETDESLLDIQKIYDFSANLKNISIENLLYQISMNLKKVFPKIIYEF